MGKSSTDVQQLNSIFIMDSSENGVATPPISGDEAPVVETPKTKSVTFAEPETEGDLSEDDNEKDLGLPPQPDNPDFSKLNPLSLEIIGRCVLTEFYCKM